MDSFAALEQLKLQQEEKDLSFLLPVLITEYIQTHTHTLFFLLYIWENTLEDS